VALEHRGDVVIQASLRDPATAAIVVAGADAVVNLAGEPVAQRWTRGVKTRIRASRVDAADALRIALERTGTRLAAYVSASGVGYYGTSEEATFDESSLPGSDFLADVCAAWESAADRFASLGARVAKVRTGLALGRDGGALGKLLPIFKAGLGGRVAAGRQWCSWIALDDVVKLYLIALDGVEGALNAVAPNPVRNAEFTQALARAVHRRAPFPVPGFALQLMFGEGATILADGQRVLPARAQSLGFGFSYEKIDAALAGILG
jgi:uncharacterized protein (TIGR01777 family)